nr:MAG TPA: hypothetical protein [Crassvirales sp.]
MPIGVLSSYVNTRNGSAKQHSHSSLFIRFTPHTLAPHTPSYAHLRKSLLLGMCQTLLQWHLLLGIPLHCHLPL